MSVVENYFEMSIKQTDVLKLIKQTDGLKLVSQKPDIYLFDNNNNNKTIYMVSWPESQQQRRNLKPFRHSNLLAKMSADNLANMLADSSAD